MNEKTVETIFGSADRIKVIRLFVFNPEKIFDVSAIVSRTGASKARAAKETKNLAKIGLVNRKARGFVLNKSFAHLFPLKEFLSATNPDGERVADKMKRVGKIKFLAIAGVFIGNQESRLDILVAGDKIKEVALEKAIKGVESEIGRELSFSFFETEDFKYRLAMHDKLVLDVLDFPHEKIVNKLGI